jgi:hypothetical protein
MAKQTKDKAPSNVRVPKGKTPKQIAKREANIKAAQDRLIRLQAKQRAEQADKQRIVSERLYLQAAINGPAQRILNNWLKGREATFERVNRFFKERPHLPQPLESQPETPIAA